MIKQLDGLHVCWIVVFRLILVSTSRNPSNVLIVALNVWIADLLELEKLKSSFHMLHASNQILNEIFYHVQLVIAVIIKMKFLVCVMPLMSTVMKFIFNFN
jgi:hypothetical protein